jgi:hypothetical protein
MDVRLASVHSALAAHQRKDVHMHQEQCSGDSVNIEEGVKRGLLLQEASSCGKPCAKGELLSVET